jgi:hypothetical protein
MIHNWNYKALTYFRVGSGEFGTIFKTVLLHFFISKQNHSVGLSSVSTWSHKCLSSFRTIPWHAPTLRCIVNGKQSLALLRANQDRLPQIQLLHELSKHTKALTNFMKENPSRESNSNLVKNFPAFCRKKKGSSQHTKQLATWSYPEPDYLVHTL